MKRVRAMLIIVSILGPFGASASLGPELSVAFLDVGQGDAIYIEAPNGNQMIIDGGPGSVLVDRLLERMPFGDRSIDVLVVTNPDADHYSGFIDVLKQYSVGAIIESGTRSSTKTFETFTKEAAARHVPRLLARAGMRVTLDSENSVYFDVLFPDQDVSSWARNDGSIVGRLVYGKTSVMFTGDATKKTENILVSKYSRAELESTVLKVGHHGSRTSSGDEFVWAVAPEYAVMSLGKGNTYGHPHAETLATFVRHAIAFFRTDYSGTVTLHSDGVAARIETER